MKLAANLSQAKNGYDIKQEIEEYTNFYYLETHAVIKCIRNVIITPLLQEASTSRALMEHTGEESMNSKVT